MAVSINLGEMFVVYKAKTDELAKGMNLSKSSMSSADAVAQSTSKNISTAFTQSGTAVANFGSKTVSSTDMAKAKLTLLESKVTETRNEIKKLEGAADAGKSVTGLDEARAKLTLLEGEAQKARSSLQSLASESERASTSVGGSFLGSIKSSVGGLLNFGSQLGMTVMGFQQLGQAAMGLGSALLGPNASMEQTTVGFETLLGKGKATQDFMKGLSEFAASTPFEFPELATNAQHMLAFGFTAKEVLPTLTDIGDAMSAMGKGSADIDRVVLVFGQMKAAGKVNAGDMMQLASQGIPAWKFLAEAMHKTIPEVQDLSSKGLIPAQTAIDALTKGMHGMFGGGMAAQATTFNGLMSTLKDNAGAAMRAFTGPLFNMAKGGLTELGNLVSSKAFQDFATMMGEKVGGALNAVGKALGKLSPFFSDLKIAITEEPMGVFLATLGDVGSALGDAAGAVFDLWTSISPLGGLFKSNGKDGGMFATALYTAGDIMQNNITPAIKDFTAFLKGLKPVVEPIGKTLQEMFKVFGDWLKQNGPALERIGKQIFEGIGIVVKEVAPVVSKELLPAIKDLWAAAGPVVSKFIDWVDKSHLLHIAGMVLGAGIKEIAHNVSNVIKAISFIVKAYDWWLGTNDRIKKNNEELWKNIQQIFGNVGKWFHDRFAEASKAIEDAGKFIGEKWNQAINGLTDLGKWLYDHNTYIKAFVDDVHSKIDSVTKWINDTWQTSTKWVSDRWAELSGASQQRMGEISKTIGDNLAVAGGKWNEFWGGVGAVISSAWNTYIATPIAGIGTSIGNTIGGWANSAWQWGANLIQGFVNGIVSKTNSVGASVAGIAGQVLAFLGFHSPTKEGAGREADTWAPAFIDMYASGLEAGIPRIEGIMSKLASPVMNVSAETRYTALAPAMMAASSRESSGGVLIVHNHIHLDEREIGESVERYQLATLRSQGGVRR